MAWSDSWASTEKSSCPSSNRPWSVAVLVNVLASLFFATSALAAEGDAPAETPPDAPSEESADGVTLLLAAFAFVMLSTGIVVSRLVAFGLLAWKEGSVWNVDASKNLYARMSLL